MTPIVLAPAEILTTKTLNVDPTTPGALQVAGELMETLRSTLGAHGVAAPQIGSSLRLMVYLDSQDGPTVLANAHVVDRRGKQTGWESCLSFPDLKFRVERAQAVVVEADDILGLPVRLKFHDFPARLMQHEIDHLDGRLVDAIAKDSRRRT